MKIITITYFHKKIKFDGLNLRFIKNTHIRKDWNPKFKTKINYKILNDVFLIFFKKQCLVNT